MSKERLEEIVEKISEQIFDRIIVPQTKIAVEYQDIKFLINVITEQAERVQELEELVEDYKTVNKELHQRGRKVRKQNRLYREALGFYGNKENYLHEPSRLKATRHSKVMEDYGEKARQSLESESNE